GHVHVAALSDFRITYARVEIAAAQSTSPGALHEVDAADVEQGGSFDLAVDPSSGRALLLNGLHLPFFRSEVAARVIDDASVGAPVLMSNERFQEIRVEAPGGKRFGTTIDAGDRLFYRQLDERGNWSSPAELAAPDPAELLSSRPEDPLGRPSDLRFPS